MAHRAELSERLVDGLQMLQEQKRKATARSDVGMTQSKPGEQQ
jgi:hypothetical protein